MSRLSGPSIISAVMFTFLPLRTWCQAPLCSDCSGFTPLCCVVEPVCVRKRAHSSSYSKGLREGRKKLDGYMCERWNEAEIELWLLCLYSSIETLGYKHFLPLATKGSRLGFKIISPSSHGGLLLFIYVTSCCCLFDSKLFNWPCIFLTMQRRIQA